MLMVCVEMKEGPSCFCQIGLYQTCSMAIDDIEPIRTWAQLRKATSLNRQVTSLGNELSR